jgi:hypothetical protein
VCDVCTKTAIALAEKGNSAEEIEELLKFKTAHLDEARLQRRVSKAAFEKWGKEKGGLTADEAEELSSSMDRMMSDCIDDPLGEISSTAGAPLRLGMEDFGGNTSMPSYGNRRPSIDYYTSNLNQLQLIVCDLTTGENYIYVYDERAAGKDGDTLTSLRWCHHFRLYVAARDSGTLDAEPEILFTTMDNCVG